MYAVIYIPDFYLQAALRPEPELRERPVALADEGLIIQATKAAAQREVAAGLTPSQAAARCSDLLIKNRNAAQELSAGEILLQTAHAFSPCIESTGPGICTMDLKGLSLVNENAARQWAGRLREALLAFHLDAQIGFGPNPGLALLVARAAGPVLWVEDAAKFALELPMAALQPDREIAGILELWGVRTIGAFAALGKDQMARRLGSAALSLFDSLEAVPPLKLVSPPQNFVERMDFEKEIETVEPLLFVLNRFLEQLTRRLEAVYLVMAELRLRLALSSGASCERMFRIPSPTNKVQTLFRMLQTHLENLRTDSPIISLELAAQPTNPGRHQFGLFEATLRNPNQFAETRARLIALCGENNVGTPQKTASHRPDAFTMQAAEFAENQPLLDNGEAPPVRQGLQLRRFRPPMAAQVEWRGPQPALIRSRSCNGVIISAQGPFASSGDWWEPSGAWVREDWDVQTREGGLYRIFRSNDGFFVEGVYD